MKTGFLPGDDLIRGDVLAYSVEFELFDRSKDVASLIKQYVASQWHVFSTNFTEDFKPES